MQRAAGGCGAGGRGQWLASAGRGGGPRRDPPGHAWGEPAAAGALLVAVGLQCGTAGTVPVRES